MSVRSEELKVSPDCKYSGAAVFKYDAVGLVKLISYAMITSPGAVKLAGREVVTAVSDTEKSDEEVSRMLKSMPVVVPLVPMFKAKRSPVAVVAEPGDQSRLSSDPVPAAPVREVAVVLRSSRVPVVKVFPVVAI